MRARALTKFGIKAEFNVALVMLTKFDYFLRTMYDIN
jgi:hypothetical protein